VSFIDDVLVKTESEEKNDKLVENILTMIEANKLYVKPEKYK